MASDGFFRGSIAVERRRADPIDAARDAALECRPAGRFAGIDENPAGDAAAERELRDFEPGPPKDALPHVGGLSARSLNLWILPVAVFGKSVRNSITRGYL